MHIINEINTLILQSENIERRSPKEMLLLAERACKMSLTTNYKKGIAKSYFLLGRANLRLGHFSDARNYLFKSLDSNESDLILEAEIFNALGSVNLYLYIFDEAYKYFQKSLNIAIKINNKAIESKLLNNIGEIYRHFKDYDTALQYYIKSEYTHKELENYKATSVPLANIASVYMELGQFEKAQDFAFKALEKASVEEDKLIESACFKDLANIERENGNFDKALDYLSKSSSALSLTNEKYHASEIYIEYSKIYLKISNFESAEEYLHKALCIAEEIDSLPLKHQIYTIFSELFESSKNDSMHLYYLRKVFEIIKKMEEEDNKQKLRIIKFQKEADFNHKEKEIYKILNDQLEEKTKELEKQTKELFEAYFTLEALSDIGRQITSILDLNKLFEIIYQKIKTFMKCDAFGIGIYNDSTKAIEYKFLIDEGEIIENLHIPISKNSSFTLQAYKEIKPLLVNSLSNPSDLNQIECVGTMIGNPMSAFIFHPLIFKDYPIGVVTVQSKTENVYDNKTISILETLSHYISIAINNAHNSEKLKSLNLELDKLSKRDVLTNISNKRHFYEYLNKMWNKAVRSKEYLSILMIDIDFFKEYNDYYGHIEGDRTIKRVADIIKENVKRSGDLIARFGGDEFIVLLYDADKLGALQVAQSIQSSIYEEKIPHLYSKISNDITLSIGVASMIPQINTYPSQLIEKSDSALYSVKEAGRNSIKVQ
jgi:diguanylate cyclase (GGDEF)-like protein